LLKKRRLERKKELEEASSEQLAEIYRAIPPNTKAITLS